MRAILIMGTLVLMAACAEHPSYENPAPKGGYSGGGASSLPPPNHGQPGPSSQAYPCNRADYPAGPAGDTAYTNCVIES